MESGRRQWLAMMGAVAAGVGAASAAPVQAPQRVHLALSARNSLYHLPVMLAERLGYFRQQGLQVQLTAHESGQAALGSVLRGESDVMAGAFEHLFELQRKGLFFQAFVQTGQTPMLSLGVSTVKAPPRSWQDLRSARIGISAFDSATHWMSALWLMRHGVQAQDVQWVEVGTSASALGALWEGQIDALCNPDPVMHWLEQRGDVRLIAEARTASGTQQLAGGPLPGGCLMAREEFLLRHPQLAAGLTDAVVQALRWLQTAGPADLFKVVPAAPWLTDRAVYLGAIVKHREAYSRDGLIREESVFNAWRMHVRVASPPANPRQVLARTFTNTYVTRSRTGRAL